MMGIARSLRSKVLSLLLAGTLVLVAWPSSALAEAAVPQSGEDAAEAEVLVAGEPAAEGNAVDAEAIAVETGVPAVETEAAPAETEATAAEEPLTSQKTITGTWGTCPWELTADGTLTIRPGTGKDTGELAVDGEGNEYVTNCFSPWYEHKRDIRTVRFVAEGGARVVAPRICSGLLMFDKLESVDVSGLDFSQVEYATNMFNKCYALPSVELSSLDTSSLRDASWMFQDCTSLRSANLAGWDTRRLESLDGLFWYCENLASVNVAGWDTSSVRRMAQVFVECTSLKRLDLSSWRIGGVADLTEVFVGCASLVELDLSGFDMAGVASFDGMFRGCRALRQVKVGEGFVPAGNAAAFPKATASNGMWWSVADSAWYSVEQIVSERSGIADTYRSTQGAWVPRSLQDKQVKIEVADQAYTGKALMPEVAVWYGGERLARGVDYELAYADNVAVGTAKVVASGVGDYTGTVFATFKIVRAFPDVKAGAWYEKVVYRAADLGLIAGYVDGRFGPDDRITRGQVAVVLWRMAGSPKPAAGAKAFKDVVSGAYYSVAVRWAAGAGVVNGYADGRFCPNDKVTREQLAAMLANYARKIGGLKVTGSLSDFSGMDDAANVSSWARSAVGWCFRNKVLSGSNNRINPKGNATRAEAAKMLVGLYNLVQ